MALMGAVLHVADRRMLLTSPPTTVCLAIAGAGHVTFNALNEVGVGAPSPAGPSLDLPLGLVAVHQKDSAGLARAARKLHS